MPRITVQELEARRGEFLAEAGRAFDQMLGSDGQNGLVTFAEREERACGARKRVGNRSALPPPLTFARPVGLALANASAVVVDDSDIGNRYREAGTPTLLAPRTVQVSLALVGPISVLNTFLTDGANTGLAAPGDGGMWPGMTNVVLPFA